MVQEPQTSSGLWSPHPGFPWGLRGCKARTWGPKLPPNCTPDWKQMPLPTPSAHRPGGGLGSAQGTHCSHPSPMSQRAGDPPTHNGTAHHVLKGPTIIRDTARLKSPDTQLVTYRPQPQARCLCHGPYCKCEAGLFQKSIKCLSGRAQACKGSGNPQHALGCLPAQAPWAVQCR